MKLVFLSLPSLCIFFSKFEELDIDAGLRGGGSGFEIVFARLGWVVVFCEVVYWWVCVVSGVLCEVEKYLAREAAA